MHHPLSFEQLEVGDTWTTRARTVTEADVVNFAGMTGDFDPLHVDHEFAAQSPFRKPIAHGLLGLSLAAGLCSNSPWVRTDVFLGIYDWKFLKPIFIGDTVHVVNEIVQLEQKGRCRGHVHWKRQLVNQRDEVVQEGSFETLVAASNLKTNGRQRPQVNGNTQQPVLRRAA